VLARIHIDVSWAAELRRALDEACRVVRSEEGVIDVLVPSTAGAEQARVELAFFLRAWVLDHPGAIPRIGRCG
jgi:hypothetical protein